MCQAVQMLALDSASVPAVASLREAYEAFVRSAIDDGRRAGVIRPDLPSSLLTLHLFSLTNRTMLSFRPEGPLAPDQLGNVFASLFLSGASALPSAHHN